MSTAIFGTFHDGSIELEQQPPVAIDARRVLVTFLGEPATRQEKPNLTTDQIVELRWKLAAWEDDWNAPGMEAYDKM